MSLSKCHYVVSPICLYVNTVLVNYYVLFLLFLNTVRINCRVLIFLLFNTIRVCLVPLLVRILISQTFVGRQFYACSNSGDHKCTFFLWADQCNSSNENNFSNSLSRARAESWYLILYSLIAGTYSRKV